MPDSFSQISKILIYLVFILKNDSYVKSFRTTIPLKIASESNNFGKRLFHNNS